MSYTKQVWTDRRVQTPGQYTMTTTGESGTKQVTLAQDFGEIYDQGSPVNAERMNHIEDGIKDLSDQIDIPYGLKATRLLQATASSGSTKITSGEQFVNYQAFIFALHVPSGSTTWIRATAVVPYALFTNVELSYVDSGGTQRWASVQYTDQTHATLGCSSNMSTSAYITITGIKVGK